MLHYLITIIFAPFLLIQGKYVRKTTPKLPEPNGARLINKNKEQALKILIIGDSAAAGVGVNNQQHALLGQVNNAFQEYSPAITLMASTGATTQDTIHRISALADEPFNIVLISLGVNDITRNISTANFFKRQQLLQQQLTKKFSPELIVSTSVPPMHLFPALPQPLRWYLGKRAKSFNHCLANLSESNHKVSFLSLELPSDPNLMATDGFHPGASIYKHWADATKKLYLAI